MTIEPLGLSSGVVSFIGLAGQALSGVSFLHNFVVDVQDAPEFVGRLKADLENIKGILQSVTSYDEIEVHDKAAEECFLAAVRRCIKATNWLSEFAEKRDVSPQASRPKKILKQLHTALKRPEFEQRARFLESAKLSLVMAHKALDASIQRQMLKFMQTKIDTLLSQSLLSIPSPRDIGDIDNGKISDKLTLHASSPVLKTIHSPRLPWYRGRLLKDTPYKNMIEAMLDSPLSELLDAVVFTMFLEGKMDDYGQLWTHEEVDPVLSRLTHLNRLSALRQFFRKAQNSADATCQYQSYSSATAIMSGSTQHGSFAFTSCRVPHRTWRFSFSIEIRLNPSPPRRVPNDSPIIQACSSRDIKAVKHLFTHGEASPFDTDEHGQTLIQVALRGNPSTDMFHLVKLLVDNGADTSAFASSFLYSHETWLYDMKLIMSLGKHSPYTTKRDLDRELEDMSALHDVGRLCTINASQDPFQDPTHRNKFWSLLVHDSCHDGFPLSPFFFQQNIWPILEDLFIENPDKVISDLISMNLSGHKTLEDWMVAWLDYKYDVLACLLSTNLLVKTTRSSSTFIRQSNCKYRCRNNSGHIAFAVLCQVDLQRYSRPISRLICRHLHRVLCLLIKKGYDPTSQCSCAAEWNTSEGIFRSMSCVAAERGLLAIWTDAVCKSGADSDFLDMWYYSGISDMFDNESRPDSTATLDFHCSSCQQESLCSISNRKSSSTTPISWIGSTLLTTIASII